MAIIKFEKEEDATNCLKMGYEDVNF